MTSKRAPPQQFSAECRKMTIRRHFILDKPNHPAIITTPVLRQANDAGRRFNGKSRATAVAFQAWHETAHGTGHKRPQGVLHRRPGATPQDHMNDECGIRITHTKRLQKRLQHGTAIFLTECRLQGLLKEKNPVSNEADVYNAIREQVAYARNQHPETLSLSELGRLLHERAATCSAAAGSLADPNNQNNTARLAIQVATLAIRMLQDHDLPLPEAHETST